jgi:hypothetical protein
MFFCMFFFFYKFLTVDFLLLYGYNFVQFCSSILAFNFSFPLQPNCRNWSLNYLVLVFFKLNKELRGKRRD